MAANDMLARMLACRPKCLDDGCKVSVDTTGGPPDGARHAPPAAPTVHAAQLRDNVVALQEHANATRTALLQLQQHVQHAGGTARSTQDGLKHMHKRVQALQTQMDSLQRQVASVERTQTQRHTDTQLQLQAAARMMAAVYPDFIHADSAADSFTRCVAEEMQRLARESSWQDGNDNGSDSNSEASSAST